MTAHARVLVTGATGIVGSELRAQLAAAGCEVTGTSARGDAGVGVVAWRMDVDPLPPSLRGPWDVVVHAAASTRWSMTEPEAVASNVAPLRALGPLIGDGTRLVALSTAHVEGLRGSIESHDLADYRNTYEWSKAEGERLVRGTFPEATIVRFPIVVGRRTDGAVARFTGFYKLLAALASGLIPAIVAKPDGYLDVVPVDDVADRIVRCCWDDGPKAASPVVIGRGGEALRVGEILEVFFDTIDAWRAERGIDPLPRPPILAPDRWERFFLPFAREHLSPLQLRTIDVFSEFQPYMCLDAPFDVTDVVDDIRPAVANSVRAWADAKPRSASATPEPWQA